MSTAVGYVWRRVIATCRDCKAVVDLPAFIPDDTRGFASLIHTETKHYVDLEVRPRRGETVTTDGAGNVTSWTEAD